MTAPQTCVNVCVVACDRVRECLRVCVSMRARASIGACVPMCLRGCLSARVYVSASAAVRMCNCACTSCGGVSARVYLRGSVCICVGPRVPARACIRISMNLIIFMLVMLVML